jgi:hypothetical protein
MGTKINSFKILKEKIMPPINAFKQDFWWNKYPTYPSYIKAKEGEAFKIEDGHINLELVNPNLNSIRTHLLNVELVLTSKGDTVKSASDFIHDFSAHPHEIVNGYHCNYQVDWISAEQMAREELAIQEKGEFTFFESVNFENRIIKQDWQDPSYSYILPYKGASERVMVANKTTMLQSLCLNRTIEDDLHTQLFYDRRADNAWHLEVFLNELFPSKDYEKSDYTVSISGRKNVETLLINFVYYGYLPPFVLRLAKSHCFNSFLEAHPEVKGQSPLTGQQLPKDVAEFKAALVNYLS